MTSAPAWARWYKLIRANLPSSPFYSNHASAHWCKRANSIDQSVCIFVDTFPWSSSKGLIKGSLGDGCRDRKRVRTHTCTHLLKVSNSASFSALWMSGQHLKTFTPDLYISYWSLSQSIRLIHPKVITSIERGETGETRQRKREKEISKKRETIHFCEWVWRKFLAVFVALIDLWPTMSLYLHAFCSHLDT